MSEVGVAPAPRNVVLIGFSGTGKSVVARRLATRLGWRLVDIDAEIVRREGKSIHAIFASLGETAFRAIEMREVERACTRSSQVIATGGGAAMHPRSRALLRHDNVVVLLDATDETIHERLSQSRRGERRPMLEDADPLRRIRALKKERETIYRLAAHQVISTDRSPPEAVAEQVAERVRALLEHGMAGPDQMERRFRAGSEEFLSVVAPNALRDLPRYLDQVGLDGRVRLITDEQVGARFARGLEQILVRAGRPTAVFTLPAGESAKTLANAERAYDWLLRQGSERGDIVVALGGGVVGDLAGFVAATFLRGVPLVQIPTTLLAMVDSSIGGKVGVNHALGKNLIGAFHQPKLVLADTEFLRTLPRRELTAGWAEVVKAGLILDLELFEQLEANPGALLRLDPDIVVRTVARGVEIKALVVAEDERESGRRMLLNYGHTVGHALEAASRYERFLHGEAVAVGMTCAAFIAEELGMLSRVDSARQSELLQELGLPLRAPGLATNDLWLPLRRDKKALHSKLRWVLLECLGQAVVRGDVPESVVSSALEEATHESPETAA